MEKKVIACAKAPAALGPYSQGIEVGNIVFLSGQLGIDPAVGKLVEGGAKAQAARPSRTSATCSPKLASPPTTW